MNIDAKPILIIDDDAFQRRMIRIKLQTRGYEVNEAKDGMEALGFLAEQSYSMVLLDIVMPQLNGWEVLDQIRNTLGNHDLPVIMMTAEDNNYDPEAALKRGATDYLTKPIDFLALNERLDEYVNGTDDKPVAPKTEAPGEAPDEAEHSSADDTGAHACAKPLHSLLDGLIQNLPGVFFRAVGDAEHNVQLSFESNGLNNFLGQKWGSVQEIFASLETHDRHEVNRQFREHSINLSPILLRFPCRTRAGRVGWIECRTRPHRLPSGETVWDTMLLDVTEQKELELAAIRSREAAKNNPSPEHLPLLEMYRRFHAAWSAGENTDEFADNIVELEQALAETLEASEGATAPHKQQDLPQDMSHATYRDETGFIHQCAQCRRVQNFNEDGAWELVTELTHQMPLKTSHTICADCAEAEELLTTE